MTENVRAWLWLCEPNLTSSSPAGYTKNVNHDETTLTDPSTIQQTPSTSPNRSIHPRGDLHFPMTARVTQEMATARAAGLASAKQVTIHQSRQRIVQPPPVPSHSTIDLGETIAVAVRATTTATVANKPGRPRIRRLAGRGEVTPHKKTADVQAASIGHGQSAMRCVQYAMRPNQPVFSAGVSSTE